MKRFLVVTIGLAATFGLLSSCSDGLSFPTGQTPSASNGAAEGTLPDLSLPNVTLPNVTLPNLTLPNVSLPDVTLPDLSLPAISLPTDFTIPQETIDLMIKQFEDAGMKVDRACFNNLLSDPSLRKLVSSSATGSPSPEFIQKFLACVSA